MIEAQGEIYEFEGFRLDVIERRLLKNGGELNITPKAFDLLALLVRESGHLLTKDRIIEELWSGSFVEEANLNVNISALRRVLGDTAAEQRLIETVPRQGYRFVAAVTRVVLSEPEAESADVPTIVISDPIPESPVVESASRRSRRPVVAVGGGLLILLALFGGAWIGYKALATKSGSPRSVAVLPFRPLGQSSSDEALELGMTDTLITKLGKIRALTVRPTSAVRRFADQNTDAIVAGKELKVEAVLDGKIQRDGNKVRVSVQLLRVSDGETLWSDTFDDFFTNIFAVQDSISDKMIRFLELKLTPVELESVEKRHTESAEAYELYLQAERWHLQITAEGSRNAIKYYEQALAVDPKYAMAWSAAVGAYMHMVSINENRGENLQKARIAAYTALSLDPELPESHEAVASILDFADWNWPDAEREYLKAIELGRNREGPHYSYSLFLSRFKRHEEAVREIRIAQQILPNEVYIQNQLGITLFRARRFEEAIVEATRSLEMKPDGVPPRVLMFKSYLELGKIAEAEVAMRDVVQAAPDFESRFRTNLYLKTGRIEEARALVRPSLHELNDSDVAVGLALNYLRYGDLDKVFELLEISFQRRESILTTINVEPDWDPIRGDPRYADLMRRIGLPP